MDSPWVRRWLRPQLIAALLALLPLFALRALAAEGDDLAVRWLTNGKPGALAQQALQILQQAGEDGLNPADYLSAPLTAVLHSPAQNRPLPESEQAAFALALNDAMRRYLHDLRYGRIDPGKVYANIKAAPALDIPATLNAAIAARNLDFAVKAATPRFPLYQVLKPWLARYRALAGNPAWNTPLPPIPGKKLAPGQRYAGTALLAERLMALGDLPSGTGVPDRYDGALVDGVRQFQTRHGITPDGVIGKTTFDRLAVPPAARAEQIALTMERLRWTPLLNEKRMLLVNLPEFVLRGLEIDGNRVTVALQMNVIVGKALNTRTPLLDEQMRQIEFAPYWKVPTSIARGELVPQLRRKPADFDKEGFEFVRRGGEVVTRLSDELLSAVLRGDAQLRQRPGPRNALGNVKFIFPNNDQIYMHHTPSVSLFQRDRRDLSHGCIRVENPQALAEFVLQDDPEWPRESIRQAMAAGQSRTLRLKNPVTVVIAYGTAVVKQREGPIFFYDDIYGHDQLLRNALQAGRMSPSAAPAPAARPN